MSKQKKPVITTWYPGVGADKKTAELYELVGKITATWAQVEDVLFQVFVVALTGTWLGNDLRPYRAVFFSFSSFEQKKKMVNSAIKTRFAEDPEILDEWRIHRRDLEGFAELRNKVAHLQPSCKSSLDPNADAVVRLIPPFWKSQDGLGEFEEQGYSAEELWEALGPFWGSHPSINHGQPLPGHRRFQMTYRIQQFAQRLGPPKGNTGVNN